MPSFDNRTMTAQRFKRRPPMWVVAALSCSIALLIAGIVIAIVSTTHASAPSAKGSSSASASGAPSASGADAAKHAGPFGSARAAFGRVLASPHDAPAATTPSSAVTAPPPVAAAADVEPTATASDPEEERAEDERETEETEKAAARPAPRRAPRPRARPRRVTTSKAPAELGAITVVCMPKCDQIVDNGTKLGPGHIFNRPVASGRHVLQLSAPNGVKKNLVVQVVPGETREVRISMDR